jgi:hypothetical protein
MGCNEADEITHRDHSIRVVISDLQSCKLIFDRYHQFQAIKPIGVEIFKQACSVCDPLKLDMKLLGDETSDRGGYLFMPGRRTADYIHEHLSIRLMQRVKYHSCPQYGSLGKTLRCCIGVTGWTVLGSCGAAVGDELPGKSWVQMADPGAL